MQEVVCIHLGQSGVQIANAAWELFCIEHGIEANGRLKESLTDNDSQAFRTFFCESPNGQYVPRCLSFDLEPTVVDEVRTGNYRNLFHPEQIINGFEDGANNYARGHFTVGKTMIDDTMMVLRKIAENCDSLQGFFLIHSHGGGTGSGFTSLVLDHLNIEYAKSPRIQLSVFPSPVLSPAVVEPYNCVLSACTDIEKADITILVDNEAVYLICNNLLDISRPTFSNINRIISHVFSDLTVSLRFESSLNADFIQMSTNLIPFPRIHFPLVSHAPLICSTKAGHENLSVSQITRSVFDTRNQLLSCDAKDGLYMSCVLQYRGNVTPKDVNEAIFELKRRQEIKFVDWCPTGFKLGINSQPSAGVPSAEMAMCERSVSLVTNTAAIKVPIDRILEKFETLFLKRSFVHWFVGEGMEEGEFNEAREEFKSLIQDYIEVSTPDDPNEDKEIFTTADIRKSSLTSGRLLTTEPLENMEARTSIENSGVLQISSKENSIEASRSENYKTEENELNDEPFEDLEDEVENNEEYGYDFDDDEIDGQNEDDDVD